MPILLLILGAIIMAGAIALLVMGNYLPAGILGMVSVLLQALSLFGMQRLKKQTDALEKKYGTADPAHWTDSLREYETALRAYNAAQKEYQDAQGDVEVRLMVMRKRRDSLCGRPGAGCCHGILAADHEQMGSLPHRPAGSPAGAKSGGYPQRHGKACPASRWRGYPDPFPGGHGAAAVGLH